MHHRTMGDVAIHFFSFLENRTGVESLAGTLSHDEIERARSFYFEKDRTRYIIARGLLRAVIGERIGISPDTIHFTYNAYGKPEIKSCQNPENYQFNISHSGDYGIIAVTTHNQVGIDIEKRNAIENMDRILRMQFSPEEHMHFTSSDDKANCFYSIWVQKEAVMKASGKGFSFGFRHWNVDPGKDDYVLTAGGDTYHIRQLCVDDEYSAAVAVMKNAHAG